MQKMDIKKTLKLLPDAPGVYLMKDAAGKIIYIGKATSLKKRVGSYFNKTATSYKADLSSVAIPKSYTEATKEDILASNVADIDYITTASEEEALLLEVALVKEKQPKFNVMLKDDKRYPVLKLTLDEKFPRLVIARRRKPDGAMYFGPYTSAKLLRKALSIMRRIFPLRTCRIMPKTACLNYHIGQCIAPCIKKIGKTEYKQIVDDVTLFLKGRKKELISNLSQRMKDKAIKKNFEEAARLRDQTHALTSIGLAKSAKKIMSLSVLELQAALEINKPPLRIEAFDISNISGKEAVGSMVSFFNAKPDKSNYRRFRIKTIFEVDDYKMIEEVLIRRYTRAIREQQQLTDLIIIDGGKGHVGVAKKALDNLNIGSIPALGIAKKQERVFSPKGEINFDEGSRALQLIMRVRDEAHRFAQSYHHILRRKKIIGR